MTDLLSTVSSIASNRSLQAIATKHGLAIQTVAWEDTGRSKGSCWGPNISDVTLVTSDVNMPIIRCPNFSDRTADIKIDNFKLTIGNEVETTTSRVALKEFLQNVGKYTGNTSAQDLYDEKRDSVILTSAQFCVLPQDSKFAVRIFNYQSSTDNPAVLVILASQAGTSCQVVSGKNPILYFNKGNKAFDFHAKRLSKDREEKGKALEGAMDADERERNALMIFQVPLKIVRLRMPYAESFVGYAESFGGDEECYESMSYAMPCSFQSMGPKKESRKYKGIEDSVLSLGDEKGAYVGTKGSNGEWLKLERDTDFPIRCTLQMYQVTDSPDIPEEVFRIMSDKINTIYRSAEASGSLVFSDVTTARPRLTEPVLPKLTPAQQKQEEVHLANLAKTSPLFSF